jgi:DNA processing protein
MASESDDDRAADAERDRLIAWNLAGSSVRGLACRFAAGRHGAGDAALPAPLRAALEALADDFGSLAARERRLAGELGAELVTLADPAYPEDLRMLDLPPPAIYVQGTIPDGPRVAVVGARRASPYGLETGRWFGRELAAAGAAVVSGFAIGIDAAAHRGALEVSGGRTVAVLGCGLDVDYPRGHRSLGARVAAAGARLTEFPFGRLPSRWQFPVRNRLIAALADACVVIEAAPKSGSLSTARLALDLGREVMAVPGRITDELALGTNALIADGARPALDPRDVLEAIGLAVAGSAAAPAGPPAGIDGDRLALWRAAHEAPSAPEQLAARAGIGVERALVLLLDLELGGRLRRGYDGRYEAP